MALVRESLYAGLFSLLNSLLTTSGGPFVTVTRRLDHVEDVDPAEMPYAAQNQVSESPATETLQGGATTLAVVHWYIYCAIDNQSTDPSTPTLNPLVDAVVGLLPAVAGATMQLVINGVAYGLKRGPVQYFEGLLGTKAVAKIEVVVLAPFA